MSVSVSVGPQHDPAQMQQLEALRRAQLAAQQQQQLLQQQYAAMYQQQQQQPQYGARTESVTLPADAFPGKEYTFTAQDGRCVTFAVPEGMGPGSVVTVSCWG